MVATLVVDFVGLWASWVPTRGTPIEMLVFGGTAGDGATWVSRRRERVRQFSTRGGSKACPTQNSGVDENDGIGDGGTRGRSSLPAGLPANSNGGGTKSPYLRMRRQPAYSK